MTEQRGPVVDERSDAQVAEALDLPLTVIVTARQRLGRVIAAAAPPAARRQTLAKLIGDDELAARITKLSKLERLAAITAEIGNDDLPRVIDRIVGYSDADFDEAVARLEKEKVRHFIEAGQLPDLKIDLDRELGSLTLAELQHVATTISGMSGGKMVAAAPVAIVIVAAFVSGGKLAKDYKDAIDDKREKDTKDSKDGKDHKDNPDSKREKDSKDQLDRKDEKDGADSKQGKDRKDVSDTSMKHQKEMKEADALAKSQQDAASSLWKVEMEGKHQDGAKPKEVAEGGTGAAAQEPATAAAAIGISPEMTLRELLARLATDK